MQTQKNKQVSQNVTKHSLLAGAFLLLVILGAKVDLDFGGTISFTLQTLFLGLAYYYLPIKWRLAVILCYLGLGIVGVPVFNGGVGWEYFSSWPLGFFVGFVVAAFVPTPISKRFGSFVNYFLVLHFVIVTIGILWISYFGGSTSSPLELALELLPGVLAKSVAGASIIVSLRVLKSNNYI